MKRFSIILPSLTSILVSLPLLFACSHSNQRILDEADQLIFLSQDSALSHLKGIDVERLTHRQKAIYTLLTAKALVKGNRKMDMAEPLAVVVDFFRNSGDSLEIQSQFYFGRALLARSMTTEALTAFTTCYDLAVLNEDSFFAALSARELSKIYDKLLIPNEQLLWANSEKLHFMESGHHLHTSWADIDLLRAYIKNDMPDNALSLISEIDTTLYHSNRDFRVLVNSNKANASYLTGQYEDVIQCLQRQKTYGTPLNSGQWQMVSNCYLNSGDIRSAAEANDSARKSRTSRMDSIRVAWMDGRLAMQRGSYQKAAMYYDSFVESLIDESEEKCRQPLLVDLTKTMREKYIVERRYSHMLSSRNTLLWVVVILCVVLLLVFLTLLITGYRLQRRNDEIIGTRSETVNNEVKQMNAGIATILSPQLELLDHLYLRLYSRSPIIRNKETSRQFDEILAQLRSEDTFCEMETFIDSHHNSWMKRFDRLYPDLTQANRNLVILLFLGFSSSAIAFLTDRDSIKSVHTAKSRLKARLSSIESDEKTVVLKKLGLYRQS